MSNPNSAFVASVLFFIVVGVALCDDTDCSGKLIGIMVDKQSVLERAAMTLPDVPEFATEMAAAFGDVPTGPGSYVLMMTYFKSKWALRADQSTIGFLERSGALPPSEIPIESRVKMLEVDVVKAAADIFGEEWDGACFVEFVRQTVELIERDKAERESLSN